MDWRIKLHRKFIDREWYSDINTKTLFLHLLIIANYKESSWRWQIIKEWEILTWLYKLQEQTGLTLQVIRTSLNKLKSTNEITIKSTNKFSIITLLKWELYQEWITEITNNLTNNLTNEQQTTNKQLTTSKKKKNLKEVKEVYIERINKSYFPNEDINIIFKKFLEMRYDNNKIPSDYAIELLVKNLSKYTDHIKIAMLEKSIVSNRADVFPIKDPPKQNAIWLTEWRERHRQELIRQRDNDKKILEWTLTLQDI